MKIESFIEPEEAYTTEQIEEVQKFLFELYNDEAIKKYAVGANLNLTAISMLIADSIYTGDPGKMMMAGKIAVTLAYIMGRKDSEVNSIFNGTVSPSGYPEGDNDN